MVTATQMARWAVTTPAQSELPRLVRRLIHSAATTTELAMPAGDSVSLPGFDGELHSEHGNTWVPTGRSCWELSCRADVVAKANEDYSKRSPAVPQEHRATRTYVALTARRWPGKARWRHERRSPTLPGTIYASLTRTISSNGSSRLRPSGSPSGRSWACPALVSKASVPISRIDAARKSYGFLSQLHA
jgi:hypothetical protein